MSGDEGSLGDIRKALAGITRRLDALADAVGIAATPSAPGSLLDEETRAHLAGLQSLLAIGRGATRPEACLLAIDRALTSARADCVAILWRTADEALTVLAQRGFRHSLAPRPGEGIVGRALESVEVVRAGPGLGAPDPLLSEHGLGAALALPVPGDAGLPLGALLVGRRRPVPFEPDAIGTLVLVADRLANALRARSDGAAEEPAPATLFASLDLSRTARAVATQAAARLGADVAAVLLRADDTFVVAGMPEALDDAPVLGPSVALEAVATTRRPWIHGAESPADPALARCLGRTPRAVLSLSLGDDVVALLAVGGPEDCRTRLPEPFERAAALALRNARLHAESLRAAAAPSPPPRAADASPAPLGDMANLLAVVLGRLAAVRERVADPAAARDLAQAEEAAWRVAEGVRRVLGFAPRPGAHAAAPLDLAAVVRESVRATERLWANEGGVPPVELDLEPVPPVRIDPDELRQAVQHLLQNAREAGDGAGAVAVGLRWDGTSHVELLVVDQGRGMDEATRTRADEPFFTTKGPGRLGVGLAVVQAMASRHRGHLAIESVPGRGTTVRLRLPTAGGARTNRARPESPGPRRILVVDDDQAVRETLVQVLSGQGYGVDGAADVSEAATILGRGSVDLVVTDLALPGGSGLEVARTVKRRHPGTPVILITGWPGRVDAETLASHGIDALVEKPVGFDTLRTTITTLLDRASTRPR